MSNKAKNELENQIQHFASLFIKNIDEYWANYLNDSTIPLITKKDEIEELNNGIVKTLKTILPDKFKHEFIVLKFPDYEKKNDLIIYSFSEEAASPFREIREEYEKNINFSSFIFSESQSITSTFAFYIPVKGYECQDNLDLICISSKELFQDEHIFLGEIKVIIDQWKEAILSNKSNHKLNNEFQLKLNNELIKNKYDIIKIVKKIIKKQRNNTLFQKLIISGLFGSPDNLKYLSLYIFFIKMILSAGSLAIFKTTPLYFKNISESIAIVWQVKITENLLKHDIHELYGCANAILNIWERIFAFNIYENLEIANLKTAIISILVDSFAHNISAHSLSSIVWLYLKRTSELDRRFLIRDSLKKDTFNIDVSNLKELSQNAVSDYDSLGLKDSTHNKFSFSLQDLLEFMDEDTKSRFFSFISIPYSKDAPHLKLPPTIPSPIDKELLYLIKYLKNKSAFWNGVTRDLPFGGEITHWYDILYEFSNNPLFLGTIAHSEGINRVVIRVGYDKESKPFPDNTKEKYEKLTYNFLTIDISDLMKKSDINKLDLKSQKNQFPFKHIFLGEHYTRIRNDLKSDKFDVFLPGGIVGKHALYTIFENTVRNIKHVHGNPSEILFNIFISRIEEKLFQLHVWLGNESNIAKKIITDMEELLEKPIVTEDGKPILGGSSQDKICASMLYNNFFAKVEDRSITHQHHDMYPWIRIEPLNGEKNIKRSVFLWQGDLFLLIKSEQQMKDENPSRFKFTVLENEHNIPYSLISEYGLVRIIYKTEFDKFNDDTKNRITEETLYQIWNNKWLCSQNEVITIGIGNTVKYRILKDENCWQLVPIQEGIKGIPVFFFHSETGDMLSKEDKLQYRNHGQLRELFFDQDFTFKDKACKGEFIETLLTNIVIFDNRIFNRVSEWANKINLFRNKLFLDINKEKSENEQDNSPKTLVDLLRNNVKPNFIILHLSFIESLHKKNDITAKYKEADINEFINDYLDNILSENTKLVITTGRGRGLWWDKLRQVGDKNIQHILFKPIESILSAVEDGLILKDDFMVKYNLVKILIGS